MKREYLHLSIIILASICIRAYPILMNPAWGNDFGIYYGLTNTILETGEIIVPYDGWGRSYNYFPVLYVITSWLHTATGLSVVSILSTLAPIISSLTILIFYFLVKDLFKNEKVSLIACAILATTPLHAYQMSRVAPLIFGHLFMVISLFFLFRSQHNIKLIVPLYISSILIILSHHFTTYFYAIVVTLITLYSIVGEKDERIIVYRMSYLVLFTATMFSYWYFVATDVYTNYLGILNTRPVIMIVGYYVLLFVAMTLCVKMPFVKVLLKKRREKIISIKTRFAVYFSTIIGFMVFMLFLEKVPGEMPVQLYTVVVSIPIYVIIAFTFIGGSFLKRMEQGKYIHAWVTAILISLVIALSSGRFHIDRHAEYIIIPFSIMGAIGIYRYVTERDKSVSIRTKYMLLLLVANALIVYPTVASFGVSDESITDSNLSVMEWMQTNVDNTSIVTSDHRLSVLSWSYGFRIAFDSQVYPNNSIGYIWNSSDLDATLYELGMLNTTHLVIDDIMFNTTVNVEPGVYYKMTESSYDKFKSEPFVLLYRNATYNTDGDVVHWTEVYELKR